jgi:hypothetical protein
LSASSQELLLGTAELELSAEEELPGSLEDDTAELELSAEEELPGSLEDELSDELLISSSSQLGNSISGNSAQHKKSTAANARIIMKNFLIAGTPN